MKRQKGLWELLSLSRFVLATIVLVTHAVQHVPSNPVLLKIWELGAFSAVIGFLVISGYSIGHSYAQSGDGFYGRRLLRIYPLYLMSILLTLAVTLVTHEASTDRLLKVAVGNMFFLQTYRYSPMFGNAPLWTLAIEATFYLFTPVLARMSTRSLLAVAALSGAAFWYHTHSTLGYFAYLRHGLPILFIGWAWLAGFIYQRCQKNPASGMVLVSTLVGLCSINAIYNQRFAYITLLLVSLVLVCGSNVTLPKSVSRVFKFLGDVSFPLYLLHPPAFLICYAGLHTHNVAVLLSASFVVTLMALAIEHVARPGVKRLITLSETQLQLAFATTRLATLRAVDQLRGLPIGLLNPAQEQEA